jgi:hypothetical protein
MLLILPKTGNVAQRNAVHNVYTPPAILIA